jgi:hypothetical protein
VPAITAAAAAAAAAFLTAALAVEVPSQEFLTSLMGEEGGSWSSNRCGGSSSSWSCAIWRSSCGRAAVAAEAACQQVQ